MSATPPGPARHEGLAARLRQFKRQVRIPWRVQNWWSGQVSTGHYLANRLRHLRGGSAPAGRPRVLLAIPYYGFTGASAAMLAAAELLCRDYEVCFRTHRRNIMNRFVGHDIRMVPAPDGPFDICLIESGEDLRFVEALVEDGARIVVCTHGDPDKADGVKTHGYTAAQMAPVLRIADSIQYVSKTQAEGVRQSGVPHARLIPNVVPPVRPIRQVAHTGAIGFVGDTRQPYKNVQGFLRAGQTSRAIRLEIWGSNQGESSTDRVRWNGFSGDKGRIFGSFDVLVHLSLLESQGLVVLEALSAGIPCVLADLPCYDGLKHLKGVTLLDPADHAAAARAIDAALDFPEADRAALVEHWRAHHSADVIRAQWLDYLDEVMTLRRRG